MKKRPVLTLLAALLLAGLLSGCGSEAAPDPYEGLLEVSDGLGGMMWVPEQAGVEVSEYTSTDFSADGDYVYYIGEQATAEQGIDVSYYQGEIDWAAVREAGVSFAILRVGYRGWGENGALHADACFVQNLEGAKAAGLDVGVYFFSQATTAEEAAQEAAYTLSLLEGVALELPVYFDWEQIGVEQEARTDAVDFGTLTELCLAFAEPIRAAGYQPGVYFYRSLGYYAYDLAKLGDLDIWMASVGEAPAFHYAFDMWQYSYTGTVPGISTEVDLNLRFFIK